MQDIWLSVYLLTVGGSAFLLNALWRKRAYRTHPAFVAFIALAVLRTLALWPLRATANLTAYRNVWWYTEPLYLAVLGWVIGEMWKKKSYGLIAGMTVAFSVLVMIRLSFALYPAHIEYAWALALTEVSVIRWAGFAASAFAFAYLVKRDSVRAAGMVIVSFCHSLVMDMNLFRPSSLLGYLTVAGWVIALLLWLRWANKYRIVHIDRPKPNLLPFRRHELDRTH